MAYHINEDQVKAFHKDGYVILKKFFSTDEVKKLYDIAVSDNVLKSNAQDVRDQTGKNSKLTLWFTPGEDVYSMMLRSERMVDAATKLLDSDSPVCHFHSKLMQKQMASHSNNKTVRFYQNVG